MSNSFIYTYDRLNRLISGVTADSAFAERNITYDQAGNIQTLSRVYGGGLIDSLAYDYNGTSGITNQLQSIADNSRSRSTAGLPSYGTYYLYDGNGNVTSNGGKNYRITSNLLNLPDTISPLKIFSNIPNPASVYYYDANGDKLALAQGTTSFGQSPVYNQYRYYINGIQYDMDLARDTLNMTFVQTEEGRVFPYSTDTSNYYEYFLSDHLGNTTATFNTPNGSTATATSYNDYLPFGMVIPYVINNGRGVAANPINAYLYNKKELQENTQLYDYGARFYDPVVARWTSVDPHSNSYVSWSSYGYVADNPITSIDPDGNDLIILNAQDHVHGLGHAAVLIGNEKTGYKYYSKNGTNEGHGAFGPSDKNPVIGRKYASLKDFESSPDNKDKDGSYTRAYVIKTDEASDKKMEEAAAKAVKSDYDVVSQSCIDVASDALATNGQYTGREGQNYNQRSFFLSMPNMRFDKIMQENPGGTLIYLPIINSKRTRNGTVTVDTKEIKHEIIPDKKDNP